MIKEKNYFLLYKEAKTEEDKKKYYNLIIEKAKKSLQKKIAAGWEETPDGYLPPEEIEAAGFVKHPTTKKWIIPSQVYIAKNIGSGYKLGEKYVGASEKYLKWKAERKMILAGKGPNIERLIDKEIEKELNDGDILRNLTNIPF